MRFKWFKQILVLSVLFALAAAQAEDSPSRQQGPGRGPELTDTQKTCLREHGILPPGEGERKSRETVEAAMNDCGIKMPSREGRGTAGGPPPPPREFEQGSSQSGGGTIQ